MATTYSISHALIRSDLCIWHNVSIVLSDGKENGSPNDLESIRICHMMRRIGTREQRKGNNARGTCAAGYGRAQNKVGNANPDNAIDEDVDEQPVQDLALNVDNVFQADDCDAYDSDVDEAPTTQTMFLANLSSIDLVCDEAGPSYDLDNLSEVHDHDHFQDAICEIEEHGMQDDVQPSYVVGSHADYTSDSNMTPYDQYVKDNAVPVAPTYTIADNSLKLEIEYTWNTVELYERRA
ncbi:hypothetical protein Tco_1309488, partial [Tanacetum coccineum]